MGGGACGGADRRFHKIFWFLCPLCTICSRLDLPRAGTLHDNIQAELLHLTSLSVSSRVPPSVVERIPLRLNWLRYGYDIMCVQVGYRVFV